METIVAFMETTSSTLEQISGLESHIGYWLRRVSNAVSGAFSTALQEEQTSVAEWVFLSELHKRGQAAPGELADVLGLTRGAVSKIIDKLETKSWVQSDAKEGDNRYRLLSLTRAGRRNLPILARIADQNDSAFFDCLSAKEKAVLRGLLIKLAEHNRIHNVPTE
jgi:DNA-binding MarR family transcriptional regulator